MRLERLDRWPPSAGRAEKVFSARGASTCKNQYNQSHPNARSPSQRMTITNMKVINSRAGSMRARRSIGQC